MTENYETTNGEPIPDDVANVFNDPDAKAWDVCSADPTNIRTGETLIGTIYRGPVDGEDSWVMEDGHATHWDSYDRVERLPSGAVPRADRYPTEAFTYRDDVTTKPLASCVTQAVEDCVVTHVHRDHWAEHQTSVTAIDEHGTVTVSSRSGIMRLGLHTDGVNDETIELAVALSDGDTGELTIPEGVRSLKSGWHSSMEPSSESDILNALKNGDYPPHWTDNDSDPFPYAVRVGSTNNVCSLSVSVYGTEKFAQLIVEELSDTRPRPAHAGVR